MDWTPMHHRSLQTVHPAALQDHVSPPRMATDQTLTSTGLILNLISHFLTPSSMNMSLGLEVMTGQGRPLMASLHSFALLLVSRRLSMFRTASVILVNVLAALVRRRVQTH